MIKDDQSLGDQPFCRFADRIAQCTEAVSEASRRTGKPCLYAPHVSGPWPILMKQASMARKAGAGALLVCPGLVGFDVMTSLASTPSLSLPLISHPDFLGSHYVSPDSGISPSVLFGLFPRLAGADISICPTYGLAYPIQKATAGTLRHPVAGRSAPVLLYFRPRQGEWPPLASMRWQILWP